MKRLYAFLVLMALVGVPAHAADWVIDPAASMLSFTGTQAGAPFTGHFSRFSGDIHFDPAAPQAGMTKIQIETASAVTGDKQKDEALPESDWFDVKHFPQAVFEASSFIAKGGDSYEAVGKLSIRGMTVDCILPFTLTINGEAAHAKGKVTLIRTRFGVGQGAWISDEWVAFEVSVGVDITAKKKPSS